MQILASFGRLRSNPQWITIMFRSNTSCICLGDPEVIPNSFNKYFVNIGHKFADKKQPAQHFSNYLNVPSETVFNFVPVSEQNISDIIKNLKNKSSYGHDCLSNNLILIMKIQNV